MLGELQVNQVQQELEIIKRCYKNKWVNTAGILAKVNICRKECNCKEQSRRVLKQETEKKSPNIVGNSKNILNN